MAQTDTYALLFGIAILMGMGFLFWKSTNSQGVKMTEFVRDPKTNAVIQIIER